MKKSIIESHIGKYVDLNTVNDMRIFGTLEDCDDSFVTIKRPKFYSDHYRETHCIIPISDIVYIDICKKSQASEDKIRFDKWLVKKKKHQDLKDNESVEVR